MFRILMVLELDLLGNSLELDKSHIMVVLFVVQIHGLVLDTDRIGACLDTHAGFAGLHIKVVRMPRA